MHNNSFIKLSIRWILFSMFLFLISCEYESNNTYYVDLNKETYGNIGIDLMNLPDTFILYNWNNFTYNINVEKDQEISNCKLIVDGNELLSTDGNHGAITLYANDYETGFHQLRIEVRTSSGSGSMADLAGAESLHYARDWVFITDNRPLENIQITKIFEYNGRVRIEWTKSDNLNGTYMVHRNVYLEDNVSSEAYLSHIMDRDINWFEDDSYVGGPVTYRIEHFGISPAYGIPKSYNGAYPRFISVTKNGDEFKFIWDKTKYSGNFGQYELSYKDFSYINNTFFTTDNPEDTSVTYKVLFGDTVQIRLNTLSQSQNPDYYWAPERICDRITIYAGDKIPRHYAGLIHSNDPNIVYLIDYYYIKRYNIETGIPESSIETGFNDPSFGNACISPNGNYLIQSSGNNVYLLDPVSLSRIGSMDLSQFFIGTSTIRKMSVSNNGLLAVAMTDDRFWTYTSGLIDLTVGDTLFTLNGNGVEIATSPSGKYIMTSNQGNKTLYMNDMDVIKLHDLGSDEFQFNPVNEEEIFRYSPATNNSISILNCYDLNIVKTAISEIAMQFYDIDPITGLILIDGQSELYIYDLDQRKVVINKDKATYYDQQNYSLFNNTLFAPNGYKLSLIQ